MTASRKKSLTIIRSIEEIPIDMSEAEEHAFWATHELSDDLWERAVPLAADELPPPRARTIPVIVRLDEATLRRVKALARRRRTGYQALLSQLVAERLDEEERQSSRRQHRRFSAG